MRILLHDYCGHPFQVQLGRVLSQRGHSVSLRFSGSFQTPHGKVGRTAEDPARFDIRAIHLSAKLQKHALYRRRKQEIEYGRLLAGEVEKTHPEVVLSANTPIESQMRLQRACKDAGARFVYWVQDIYSMAVYRLLGRKLPLLGQVIGRYYMHCEKNLLRRSDAVVVITEDFLPMMERWGIPTEKTTVIENWAPLDELQPYLKDNRWSRAHDLHNVKTALYAGTLGMKHNPAMLFQLAGRFESEGDIRLVVISEGNGADWLEEQKRKHRLDNLVLLPFQSYEDLPLVLSSADVQLAILESDASVFSVPSKILTYCCMERPLLLAVPPENLAARIVKRNKAGLLVAPHDVEGFVEGAIKLLRDPDLAGKYARNARRYALQTFDIEFITARFEDILACAI